MTFEELVAQALGNVTSAAGQSPLYQNMLKLQSLMGMAPQVRASPMPTGRYGEYRFTDTGGSSIQLNQDMLARNPSSPAFMTGTFMHEMGHGARSAAGVLAGESGTSPGYRDAWGKLSDTRAVATAMAPDWASQHKSYRASEEELPAFAIGEHYRQGMSSDPAPSHIDATLMTEMEILLDLAQREARRKGKK